jgi:hypothetical protein
MAPKTPVLVSTANGPPPSAPPAYSGTLTLGNTTLDPDRDIVINHDNQGDIKVGETLRRQTYEIEVLTDIIKEMVLTKNFDVEIDIEKRIDQKIFLNKLSGGG